MTFEVLSDGRGSYRGNVLVLTSSTSISYNDFRASRISGTNNWRIDAVPGSASSEIVCRVGQVLSPGDSCEVGFATFEVLSDGRGRYIGSILVFTVRTSISISNFRASRISGTNNWRIDAVPGSASSEIVEIRYDRASDFFARFGRSVASQAMDLIGNRITHSAHRDDHLSVAGRTVSAGNLLNPGMLASLAASGPRVPTGARLFNGTSFQVSPGGSALSGGYALWGGGDYVSFASESGDASSDGTVATAALGADFMFGQVVAGVAVTYSSGSGSFDIGRPGQDDVGELSTSLTSAFPYARFTVGDRLLTYSVLGYGAGSVSLEGGGEEEPDSDITMRMAGLGLRGDLLSGEESFNLALRSDAFVTRVVSEEVEGRWSELMADASRVRLGLEASRAFAAGEGSVLKPQLRAGMRYDGGDVDQGFGLEVGGSVSFHGANSGLNLTVHGRTLLTHAQEGYDEWGFGGMIMYTPGGDGRGLSLSVTPTWGSTASGISRLWAHGVAHMAGDVYDGRRVSAEVGYGVATPEGRGTFTPYARMALIRQPGATYLSVHDPISRISPVSHDAYIYRLGGRLALAGGLSANVEAGRSDWLFNSRPTNSVTLNLSLNL